jgi:PIN domain nuclease of toxin-antitoxin system
MRKVKQLKAAVWDTHVWVWAAAGNEKARALEDFNGIAYLPVIAIWELGMLSMKGRVKLKPDVRTWVKKNLRPPVHLEPMHPEIAILNTELRGFHGDPADRIIVATAIVSGVPLFSADESISLWAKKTR